MLSLHEVSYEVGERSLFQNINLSLQQKKYGLVGPNGVGKSTLARLIAGLRDPSQGHIHRVGPVFYLEQDEARPKITVAEYLLSFWQSPAAEKPELRSLFEDIDDSLKLDDLSGGEWMRLRLAQAFSQESQFLILDEPTNNLDRSSRELISKVLENIETGLLLISHDREALEKMDQILELSNQGLAIFSGSFSDYLASRESERKRQSEELQRLKKEKQRRSEESVEKIKQQEKRMQTAAKKAPDMGLPKIILGMRKRNAQKTFSKLSVQESEFVEKSLKDVDQSWSEMKLDPFVRFDFQSNRPPASKIHFSATELNLRWLNQENPLWKNPLNFTVKGSERWLITGDNGSGKSTLLKILLQKENPFSLETTGDIFRSRSNIGYLDQAFGQLNPEISLLENLMGHTRFDPIELRNELAFFGFTKDQPQQKVKSLSGGEVLKAALAKTFLAVEIPDLIVLDEPTNNLDLQSLALLEKALSRFQGAILLVSHDRHFVESFRADRSLHLRKNKT